MARSNKRTAKVYEQPKQRWDIVVLVMLALAAVGGAIYGIANMNPDYLRVMGYVTGVALFLGFSLITWVLSARQTRRTTLDTMQAMVDFNAGNKHTDAGMARVYAGVVQQAGRVEQSNIQIRRDHERSNLRVSEREHALLGKLEQKRLLAEDREQARLRRLEEQRLLTEDREQRRLEQQAASGVQFDYGIDVDDVEVMEYL